LRDGLRHAYDILTRQRPPGHNPRSTL
jgi:hypothetical protein